MKTEAQKLIRKLIHDMQFMTERDFWAFRQFMRVPEAMALTSQVPK